MRSRSLYFVLLLTLVGVGLYGGFAGVSTAQSRPTDGSLDEKEKAVTADQYQEKAVVGAMNPDAINAVVPGTLTLADPTYNRAVASCTSLSAGGTAVHYDTIPFTVTASGTVVLSFETADGGSITPNGSGGGGPDTFLFVYTGSFNPAAAVTNCTAANDDQAGLARSRISTSLAAGNYIAVVTSFANTPVASTTDAPLPWTYNLAITGSVTVTPAATTAGQIVISEFRVRGPNGANDEFIELYNTTGAALTVQSADASTGLGVAAADGVARCVIPNGTIVPANGHYLCVNSVGYSLSSYPAGNGTTATGDATYTTDIPDNAGIAIFNSSTPANFTLANRIDAVGSSSEANATYKEGTGYAALTPFSIDYAFYRDLCGNGGVITSFALCTRSTPKDTDVNSTDFIFVDTNGTSAGAGQRLGAPGPENLSGPVQQNSLFGMALLDATKSTSASPNRVRDFTSDPANNSTFGTLDIRRRITNNTGAPVTRLRFRISRVTTFPAPAGYADLRPRTSSSVVVAGITDAATCAANGTPATVPCSVTVQGTTLEQPPSQPNGSGFNGSLSAGTVTLATPLAAGASIPVRFLLGIQQTGIYNVAFNIEALPGSVTPGTGLPLQDRGNTDNVITASGVSVAGRVLSGDGRGLTNARVTLSDGAGSSRTIVTGRNGRFTFEDVESGRTYIVSIGSRRYSYSPQLLELTDSVSDLVFTPEARRGR